MRMVIFWRLVWDGYLAVVSADRVEEHTCRDIGHVWAESTMESTPEFCLVRVLDAAISGLRVN